jgi:hypothetical protein
MNFLDFSKTKIQDDVTEFFDFPIFAQVFSLLEACQKNQNIKN